VAVAPISTIRADAGAAHTSTASSAPTAAMSLGRWGIPAFNTTDRPGLWYRGHQARGRLELLDVYGLRALVALLLLVRDLGALS
jgi:hypothetical protein